MTQTGYSEIMADEIPTSEQSIQNKNNFISGLYLAFGIALIIAAAPLPYGFYTLLRVSLCLFAATMFYRNFKSPLKETVWTWALLFIAILFNPVFPIHFPKEIWMVIDIALGITFLLQSRKTRRATESNLHR